MAEDIATRVATNAIEAFNSADWAGFRRLLAPTLVYEETGTGRRVSGPDAYVELCQGWKQALPDARGDIRRSVASGDTVVQEITWTGTHDGPLETPTGTVPASGAKIEVDATFWATVDGEQLKEARHHLDVLSLLRQIGAMG
nr:SnoaL-like polyketide cyclase family protein [uncultured bacterium]